MFNLVIGHKIAAKQPECVRIKSEAGEWVDEFPEDLILPVVQQWSHCLFQKDLEPRALNKAVRSIRSTLLLAKVPVKDDASINQVNILRALIMYRLESINYLNGWESTCLAPWCKVYLSVLSLADRIRNRHDYLRPVGGDMLYNFLATSTAVKYMNASEPGAEFEVLKDGYLVIYPENKTQPNSYYFFYTTYLDDSYIDADPHVRLSHFHLGKDLSRMFIHHDGKTVIDGLFRFSVSMPPFKEIQTLAYTGCCFLNEKQDPNVVLRIEGSLSIPRGYYSDEDCYMAEEGIGDAWLDHPQLVKLFDGARQFVITMCYKPGQGAVAEYWVS